MPGNQVVLINGCFIIPIKLSNLVMSMANWAERQGEVTRHSSSYGEELQRRISVQLASAIGDLESAIGI